jgi:hypothetical protein
MPEAVACGALRCRQAVHHERSRVGPARSGNAPPQLQSRRRSAAAAAGARARWAAACMTAARQRARSCWQPRWRWRASQRRVAPAAAQALRALRALRTRRAGTAARASSAHTRRTRQRERKRRAPRAQPGQTPRRTCGRVRRGVGAARREADARRVRPPRRGCRGEAARRAERLTQRHPSREEEERGAREKLDAGLPDVPFTKNALHRARLRLA